MKKLTKILCESYNEYHSAKEIFSSLPIPFGVTNVVFDDKFHKKIEHNDRNLI